MSALVAVACAAVVAWLLVPSGAGLARTRATPRRRLPGWLGPLPGALQLRVRLAGGACAGLAAWTLLGTPTALLPVVALAGAAVFVGLGRLPGPGAARRRNRLAADLPQALDLLVACLDAGLPLRVGVAEVARTFDGPLEEALAGVAARVAVGAGEAEAWRAVADAGALDRVARDVARALASGTALAPTLRRHCEDVRAEHAALVQARAKAVGVQTVLPLMVCFLPAFMLVGIVPIIAGVVIGFLR